MSKRPVTDAEEQQPVRPVAGKTPAASSMNVQTANALVTGAPLEEAQLRIAMAHFVALEKLLSLSGPRFSNARSEAANMHNVAVRRIKETLVEKRLREQRHADAMAGLIEIAVT